MRFWQSIAFVEPEQIFDVARICDELGFPRPDALRPLLHFEQLGRAIPIPPTVHHPVSRRRRLAGVLVADRCPGRDHRPPALLHQRVHSAAAQSRRGREGDVQRGDTLRRPRHPWCRRRLDEEEFDVLGVDFRTRGQRFDECIDVLRKLWTGEMVEHHGRSFDFPRVQMRRCRAGQFPSTSAGRVRPRCGAPPAWATAGWRRASRPPRPRRRCCAASRRCVRSGAERRRLQRDRPAVGAAAAGAAQAPARSGADGYGAPFELHPRSHIDGGAKRTYLEGVANNVIAKL